MKRDGGAVSQRHISDQSPFVIGLTGPIASGKSTVAEMLRQRGAEIIDADRVYRSLLIPGSELWRQVVERFGPTIVQSDGEIDRAALADDGLHRSRGACRSGPHHPSRGHRRNSIPDRAKLRPTHRRRSGQTGAVRSCAGCRRPVVRSPLTPKRDCAVHVSIGTGRSKRPRPGLRPPDTVPDGIEVERHDRHFG